MNENKYPYIADKKMYAAVMSACKYIRETGRFNQAVERNAEWYGVNAKDLEKEIRKRQAAGQRNSSVKRKYKYFVVVSLVETGEGAQRYAEEVEIVKGTSKENVSSRYLDNDFRKTRAADYGGIYAPYYYHEVIAEYDTKEDAEKNIDKEKIIKQYTY